MADIGWLEFRGCRLAYRIDGTGPPLVMIQGVGAAGTAQNPQIEQLAKQYTCLSFDNRGIGASQPRGKPLSTKLMAGDVQALMDHLRWDSAHLVGHSFGGMIALQMALASRNRVRTLSLICSFAHGAQASRLSFRLLWILLRLHIGTRPARRQAFLDLAVPPNHPDAHSPQLADRFSRIVGHDIADAPSIAREQVQAMRATDLTSRLHALRGIPTLVVNGDQDLIAPPRLGRVMAAAIPGAQYVEIAGAAHSFPILEPERCAGLILQHLAKAGETAVR
jgi:pimeloyl-ACP methyl ester carboxylesterase